MAAESSSKDFSERMKLGGITKLLLVDCPFFRCLEGKGGKEREIVEAGFRDTLSLRAEQDL